ncbi:hypothetical protein ACFOY2_02430 [Nonomuraea purpurea]|uniref:WXG100 family type VII secretion target n=1 Tax=Nonomuraea purpurea TaxID=1849276 RepID=A0ABV8FWD3_9ACTN
MRPRPKTRAPRVAGRAGDGSPLKAKNPPNPAEVQNTLRKAARLEPSIVVGLLATVPAVANVPGIWTTASNLQAGAGGQLDKGVNNLLTHLITASGTNWVAEDQKAFAATTERLRSHVDAFRTNVQWVAGHVDSIGDGFAVYWGAAAKIAQETYLRLIALQALSLAPQTRVAARVAMRTTAAQSNASLAAATGQLQRFLGSLGLKGVMGGLAAAMGGSAALQLAFMRPDGSAKIDFGKASADTAKIPTFTEPPNNGLLPGGHFEWTVKTPDGGRNIDDVVRDRP